MNLERFNTFEIWKTKPQAKQLPRGFEEKYGELRLREKHKDFYSTYVLDFEPDYLRLQIINDSYLDSLCRDCDIEMTIRLHNGKPYYNFVLEKDSKEYTAFDRPLPLLKNTGKEMKKQVNAFSIAYHLV